MNSRWLAWGKSAGWVDRPRLGRDLVQEALGQPVVLGHPGRWNRPPSGVKP